MAEILEFIIGAKDEFSGVFDTLAQKLPSLKTIAISTGVAITGVSTSLFAMSKATATANDRIAKFASRIGISTEALSQYQAVAEFSGIKVEALNVGFQRMTRRISEASVGTGVAVNALKELNIPIESIRGLKPEQQFEMIGGALSKVASQSDKVRLAMQFWDTEGVALLQTLQGGTEGLAAMRAEADRFGVTVSARAGKNAAEFNDSLTRVNMSLTGLRNAISERVMPIITALANRFAYFVADNRDNIIDFGLTVIKSLGTVAEYGAYAAAVLIDAWRGWQMIIETLKGGFATFVYTAVEGFNFLINKSIEFADRFNIGGVFDGFIAKAKSFSTVADGIIEAEKSIAAEALANINAIIDEGSALSKVDTIKEKIQSALSEIAELSRSGLAGDTESGEPEGVYPFTNANLNVTAENIRKIQDMYNEYYLSENERLDIWYEEQREKFAGHEEILTQLFAIYTKKRVEIFQAEQKDKAIADKAATDTKVKENARKEAAQKLHNERMNDLLSVFGATGKKIARTIGISRALISTYQGAARALSEYSYPYNLFVAASIVAAGIGYVNNISAAHGGLDYVPQEQTYLLDRGERVLSPNQNEDLTDFLANGSASGSVIIENLNIHILENATTTTAMLSMTKADWEQVVEDKIYPAFSQLRTYGVVTT